VVLGFSLLERLGRLRETLAIWFLDKIIFKQYDLWYVMVFSCTMSYLKIVFGIGQTGGQETAGQNWNLCPSLNHKTTFVSSPSCLKCQNNILSTKHRTRQQNVFVPYYTYLLQFKQILGVFHLLLNLHSIYRVLFLLKWKPYVSKGCL
jgi:hypothetical protein